MTRCAFAAFALVLCPLVAQAQNRFWYPNCSSGNCVSPSECVPCANTTSATYQPHASSPSAAAPPAAANAALTPSNPPSAGQLPVPLPALDPNAPPTPESGQASPSDVGIDTANDDLQTLRRELERLKLRNQEFEKSLAALQTSLATQDENVQQQLKSIHETVAKLRPEDAEGPDAATIRELKTLVEKLPRLIDESVQLRLQELRSGKGDKQPTP